jgi:pimeloyl-ACP methyl ester carboxylesterase
LPPAPTPDSEHDLVERAGHAIGVTRWPGDGPPLLLTHGAGLCADIFGPVGPRLATDWDVFAVDLRGHGRSAATVVDGHGIMQQTADLLAVVHDYDLWGLSVFGHSFGGLIALQAAGEAPERFRRVVAFEPAVPHPAEAQDTATERLERNIGWILDRDTRWPDSDALRRHFSDVRAYSELGTEFVDALIDHGTVPTDNDEIRMRSGPDVEALLFRVAVEQVGGIGHRDNLATISDLAVPVTLVCGDGSSFRLEMYEQVASVAGAPLEIIEGGHFAPFQSADRLVGLIQEYLRDR